MKVFALTMTAALLAASASAQTLLFDTGQPTSTTSLVACGSCGAGGGYQTQDGQFTLSQAASVASAQLWVWNNLTTQGSTGGQMAVVIRTDSAGLPGSAVFSQTFTAPNVTSTGEWVTFTFSSQTLLSANTPYWLCFEPVAGTAVQYILPEGAPNPLPNYAFYNSANTLPILDPSGAALGMRLSGTPSTNTPTLLIDTGTPTGADGGSAQIENFSGNLEWIAGQFVLNQAATIDSVQGYMSVFIGGSIKVNIYAGNANVYNDITPGTSIFSQTFNQPATSGAGWVTFQFAQPLPSLPAGTYWLAFEAPTASFYAPMLTGVSNPLPNYAYYENGNASYLNQNPFAGVPIDVGMRISGTTFPALAQGTAVREIVNGSYAGTPVGGDAIAGGEGQDNTSPFIFIAPVAWSYARGVITQNAEIAGAYADTSGPCSGGVCSYVGARGVAWRTWTNPTNADVPFNVNAALDGTVTIPGCLATAGVYVIDTDDFNSTVAASGLPVQNFLLNGSTLDVLTNGAQPLSLLFPNAIASAFQTLNGLTGQISAPVTISGVTLPAGKSITIIMDVSAYAPPLGLSDFASTLGPSSTLPFFSDANGDPVTALIPVGPSVPVTAAPGSLALSPSTASYHVGTPATVTAIVKDANGNPVSNAVVAFAFNSGPNSGPGGPISTDMNGQAVFTYTGGGTAGTDMIQATTNGITATPVSVTWTIPGPFDHITISPAMATIASGGTQPYTATAYDQYNNAIGDVTGSTVFGITPDGSCTGATCTASVAGPHTVTGTYNGKSATASLSVSSSNTPVITWPTPAAINFGTPLSSKQLDATANVPGTFVYSPKAGTILKAGSQTLSVTFTPTDTKDYTTATATVKLQVNQVKPEILWVPLPIVYGTPLGPFQLDALTLAPGTFSYSPAAGTILTAGQHTLTATFTPKDSTDFETVQLQATLEVLKARPQIAWPQPAPISSKTALSSTQLDATANVPGSFVYNPPAGTKLNDGTAVLTTTFTPTDSVDYQTVEAQVTIQVKH